MAPRFGIHKPCVGSINKERVATQEAETGIMKLLAKRASAKVRSMCFPQNLLYIAVVKDEHAYPTCKEHPPCLHYLYNEVNEKFNCIIS